MTQKTQWRRIAIEGVVIVGSILLAFAIDAAWDARQDEQRIEAGLRALLQELVEARSALDQSAAIRARRLTTLRELLEFDPATASLSPSRADSLLADLWGARTPYPFARLSSLDALDVSLGGEIDRVLAAYSLNANALVSVEQRVVDSWEDGLRPFLSANSDVGRHVVLRNPELADWGREEVGDVVPLLENREFRNLLFIRLNRTLAVQGVESTVYEHISDLETAIRARIGG